jgi:hypothetical protein
MRCRAKKLKRAAVHAEASRRESVAPRPLGGRVVVQECLGGGRKSTRGAAFTHRFAASVEAEYRQAVERHTGVV